ncbi:MAG: hypothetical protein NTX22_16775 [Ignavibacteriales bacterium]|nr:hypothetical protein [Ignavibacteriales bacterium]
MKISFTKRIIPMLSLLLLAVFLMPVSSKAQTVETKWLTAGSLHNWYSSIGCEIEEGLRLEQQYGMRWPAVYEHTDNQAAKALWIATTNFTDETGDVYPFKVVHVGPRVKGFVEFTPIKFELVSKFEAPQAYTDGLLSEIEPSDVNRVDPTLPCDRMLINVTNTKTGITMTRKIMQWSQEFNDNYHIFEYTLKNTGNINADDVIELPGKTLTGVYLYLQWRIAPCANSRYEIGNGTGWGMNTMMDARGDGVKVDPDNPDGLRAQFAWHGPFPAFTTYDNLGGPLWTKAVDVSAADTIGRLAAPQFVGVVTIHADKSVTDRSDDPNQPSTTSYEGSDEPNTSGNNEYDKKKNESEYGWISKGHKSPRHADKADADGDFSTGAGVDPALGTPGGFSYANGYGPYTLAPGDSVVIVVAEAVNGLSWNKCVEYGREYKKEFTAAGSNQGLKDAANLKKNKRVLWGKDSLFLTFRRAIANYKSGYNIPASPLPPKIFNVSSGGDRIILNWEVFESDPNLRGFEVWRAAGRYDSIYTKIFETSDVSVRSYNDLTPVRGFSYYYYLVSVGDVIPADPNLGIWAKKLTSSRYYSQTYDPANLKRQAGTSLSQIRVVPNPFHLSSSINDRLRFSDLERDKLAFYNIPGVCTIKIYTELGELIATIEHTDGSGDAYWYSNTSSNQIVAPGVYIAIVEDKTTGEREIIKFVIVR